MDKREYLRSLGFTVGERGRFTAEMMTALKDYQEEGGKLEGRTGKRDDGPYLGVFHYRQEIMEMARILSIANHPIRFHTQAEYELDSQLEEILGG